MARYIVFESREHRDKVNAAVMADKRMDLSDMKTPPFDSKRMIWGGFREFVRMSEGA